jgi:hypothetical protein
MKATKKTIPALLGDPQTPNRWLLRIKTKSDWCDMRFSSKLHANMEYQRIKASMTFGGAWITELTLEELYAAHEGDTND